MKRPDAGYSLHGEAKARAPKKFCLGIKLLGEGPTYYLYGILRTIFL